LPKQRKQKLWHLGALFHCTTRYPRKRGTPRVDRLAGILLCQDEVYVRDRVPVDWLTAVATHPDDADVVMREFQREFDRLGIPLCDYEGNILRQYGGDRG
jgi:hypothetical protein